MEEFVRSKIVAEKLTQEPCQLQFADPSIKERLEAYFDDFREGPYGAHLKTIIALPSAHMSSDSTCLKGVVYVLDSKMPAHAVMKQKDLCGGVSVYRIDGFAKHSSQTLDEHVHTRMQAIGEAVGWVDTSLSLDSTFKGAGLGASNCSVGVFKSIVNQDTLEEAWHIVVRSYHVHSSSALYEWIHGDPGITVAEVYSSKMYAQAIQASDANRNVIAAIIAKHLGATLDSPLTQVELVDSQLLAATPLDTNRYNVVQKLHIRGPDVYAFYSGCYGFSEFRSKMVIYGLGRQSGYNLIGYNNRQNQSYGRVESGYGFPMGPPPAATPVGEMTFTEALAKKARAMMHWGGDMIYHPKLPFPAQLDEEKLYAQMGLDKKREKIRLVKRAVYISSPDPRGIPIDSLLLWHGGRDAIPVPKDHEFVMTHLMQSYLIISKRNPRLRLHGDVIINETSQHFVLNTSMLKTLVAECKR